jgi:hypothetical protein
VWDGVTDRSPGAHTYERLGWGDRSVPRCLSLRSSDDCATALITSCPVIRLRHSTLSSSKEECLNDFTMSSHSVDIEESSVCKCRVSSVVLSDLHLKSICNSKSESNSIRSSSQSISIRSSSRNSSRSSITFQVEVQSSRGREIPPTVLRERYLPRPPVIHVLLRPPVTRVFYETLSFSVYET